MRRSFDICRDRALTRFFSQRALGLPVGLLAIAGLWLGGCTQAGSPSGSPSVSSEGQSSPAAVAQPNQKKIVFTTFTVLADMAQNVAGDRAIVQTLVKPGAEIHGYEPTPNDLVRGQTADLFLDNGLNLERWADRFYNSLPDVAHVSLTQGVEPIPIAGDAGQNRPNPHAWMSPQNALIYVDNIRQALTDLDPANAATYAANAKAYSQEIQAIDTKLRQAIADLPPDKRYLVSCEGAFSYLARDYGLKEVYLWPVNAEQQATPRQMEAAIDIVKAKQIPAVFCESTVNHEPQLQVAKEAGSKFAGVLYVDSLSPKDGPASTYLKLLEYNMNTLIAGLKN